MDQQLLDILACPKCKGPVKLDEASKGLVCNACRLIYPIEDDIPIMLVDEARPITGGAGAAPAAKGVAAFRVIEGKNKGEVVTLTKGTCKAIGRPLDDAGKTQVFNLDVNLSLDDHSKKLITEFVTKQFKKKGAAGGQGEVGLEAFKRTTDFIVVDTAVSRLHAMLFYDQTGVGILDMVSKNGTFVNGEEVESRLLKDGDEVAVGGTKIRFELK